ncbi:MAG TPA: hypothetical protein VF862_06010 [Gemmatimonadales bacterium]
MSATIRVILLTAAMAAGTVAAGWWMVPLLALGWGALGHRASGAFLAAVMAWALLLAWQSLQGPVGVLAERLAGVLPLPAWGVLAAGPLFAGVLGWSAATLGGLRRAPRAFQEGQ